MGVVPILLAVLQPGVRLDTEGLQMPINVLPLVIILVIVVIVAVAVVLGNRSRL